MSALSRIAIPILAVLALVSALALVWSKHEGRSLFIDLQGRHAERDRLDIEWGQLKLEQSAWATHGRVEQMARNDLKMVIPRPSDVQIVAP
jgi:cell division protein FtsL